MKANLEAKKAEADASVTDWKAKLDIKRLEGRAELAEDYAASALYFACDAVEDASAAIYDAMLARAEAFDVRQRATAAKK
jgi:hypothetical protein